MRARDNLFRKQSPGPTAFQRYTQYELNHVKYLSPSVVRPHGTRARVQYNNNNKTEIYARVSPRPRVPAPIQKFNSIYNAAKTGTLHLAHFDGVRADGSSHPNFDREPRPFSKTFYDRVQRGLNSCPKRPITVSYRLDVVAGPSSAR